MSDVTTIEEEYEYPGWLVFNGLYKTSEYHDRSGSTEDIVDSFSGYTRGSPNSPQSGFELIDVSNKLQQMGELNEATENFAQGLHSLRYVDEDWVEQIGYDESGTEKMYYLPNHDEIRIYWDYINDVMIFKGQKQLLKRKEGDVREALAGDVRLESVSFDFDFFLWILYKQYKNEPLSADLRVRQITQTSTATERPDNMGAGSVENSHNVLRSVLLIASVLGGKKIDEIQGDFILGNNKIKALIEFGGKVHVKVSDSPLSTLSELRRMGISLQFLSEIVNLFQDWEHLDPEDRYPPPSFFDDMAENAEDEGWEPRFDPAEVKDRYERKRQGTGDSSSNPAKADGAI